MQTINKRKKRWITFPRTTRKVYLIISLKNPEKGDHIESKNPKDHTCYHTLGDFSSGKYVIKIHRFDSGTPEERALVGVGRSPPLTSRGTTIFALVSLESCDMPSRSVVSIVHYISIFLILPRLFLGKIKKCSRNFLYL